MDNFISLKTHVACIEELFQKIEQLETRNFEQGVILQQVERLHYLGQIATLMAHNLNNPVNNITTATVSLLTGIQNQCVTLEQLPPSLKRILKNGERLTQMINHFRNFAHADRTTLVNLSLNETIENVFQLLFAGQYQSVGVHLSKDFSNPTPIAQANEFALQEILTTLFTNAQEAMLNLEEKCVTISTWQNSNAVGFNLEDNGGGIDELQLEKLFTPFFTSKNAGMGLGLYFCKQILKDLNGDIQYYSVPQGAGFRVILPIAT